MPTMRPDHSLRVFVVAGEHSGDALAAPLMTAIRRLAHRPVSFAGVGGPHMASEGLRSLFPISDVAVMAPLSILASLPRLLRRVNQAAEAGVSMRPDVVVIIDSPEFTHPIARRIRKQLPIVPIVNYVSPSVWAWRPGRAARMRAYVDHVLALLPFEPAAHQRLGGPPCTYVGHPLIERLPVIETADPQVLRQRLSLAPEARTIVVLPGSRRSEIERLLQPFGEALALVKAQVGPLNILLPTVDSVRGFIEAGTAAWPTQPHIVEGDADKFMAFKAADIALAASGTVTLELALAGVPMVVGYRVDALAAQLQFLVKTPHFALSNLVLGERAFPELMQADCTPVKLAAALVQVLTDPTISAAQRVALERLPAVMRLAEGTPSEAAARIVLACAAKTSPDRS